MVAVAAAKNAMEKDKEKDGKASAKKDSSAKRERKDKKMAEDDDDGGKMDDNSGKKKKAGKASASERKMAEDDDDQVKLPDGIVNLDTVTRKFKSIIRKQDLLLCVRVRCGGAWFGPSHSHSPRQL